ncbi:MAG: glycoside hydrolase family 9 protein, partial [bacterium]|nr:glycoside hydrolase family 9 protein [bacterium]
YVHGLRGGYHDAGDYDRRVYHLDVARQMLDLFAMLSNKMTDAQWHIPEAGNHIPDVLDEVSGGLNIWLQLQDPADGGVRGGTERLEEGGMDEPVADPRLDYYVFGKYLRNNNGVVQASAWFAAAAAQWARSILPYDAARAQQALDAAQRAYAYAVAHAATGADQADAAAELFYTTGAAAYQQDFLATGVRASFSYAQCTLPATDAAAKSACRAYWLARANDAVTWVNANNSYRCARNPYTQIRFGGGTGGHGYTWDLCKGFALSGNAIYLNAVQHDCNYVLGCNPLGRSWITGVGSAPPEFFLHRELIINGRTNIPPGYHIYGPFAKSNTGDDYGTHYETFWTNLYPATLAYPKLRAYVASEWMAGMNEFTITETLSPSFCIFAFAHLAPLPAPTPPPDPLPPGILVITPPAGATVTSALETVSVRVDDQQAVVAVQINAQTTAGGPLYARTIALDEGTNWLQVVARDASGNGATTRWWVVSSLPEPAGGLLALLCAALLRRTRK